jgi:hypothetical protein
MFKACQYVINDTNIGYGKEVSVVKVQSALYKTITWIKKLINFVILLLWKILKTYLRCLA